MMLRKIGPGVLFAAAPIGTCHGRNNSHGLRHDPDCQWLQ